MTEILLKDKNISINTTNIINDDNNNDNELKFKSHLQWYLHESEGSLIERGAKFEPNTFKLSLEKKNFITTYLKDINNKNDIINLTLHKLLYYIQIYGIISLEQLEKEMNCKDEGYIILNTIIY